MATSSESEEEDDVAADPDWSPPVRRWRLNQPEEQESEEEEEDEQHLLLMAVEVEEVVPLEDPQLIEQQQFEQVSLREEINIEIGEVNVDLVSSLTPRPIAVQAVVGGLQAVAGPSSQPDPLPCFLPPLTVQSVSVQQLELEQYHCITRKFVLVTTN